MVCLGIKYTQQVDRYRGGSIMVCVSINFDQGTEIRLWCKGYDLTDQILRSAVVQTALRIGENFEYPDDNANIHRVRVVVELLRQQGVQYVLPWPDKYSDMSPI